MDGRCKRPIPFRFVLRFVVPVLKILFFRGVFLQPQKVEVEDEKNKKMKKMKKSVKKKI